MNSTARPGRGKAELLLDLNANYYNLNAFSLQDIALLLAVFYRKQFKVILKTKILAIAGKKDIQGSWLYLNSINVLDLQ